LTLPAAGRSRKRMISYRPKRNGNARVAPISLYEY